MGWFAGVAINPEPNLVLAMTVHRSMANKPPFSEEELAVMTRLGRVAENALRLTARLLAAEMTNLAFGQVLARLDVAAYLLDGDGRMLFANPAGERMLGKAVVVTGGRLAARTDADSAALRKAIDAVLSGDPATPDQVPPPAILNGDGDNAYSVAYVLPVRTTQDHPFTKALVDARAIVVVRRSTSDEPLDPALVRDLLDVTLGEARVAALVGAGLQPREVATKLGIAEETARSVLKRVFAKTGVSRQGELAALLSRLVLR
jgi:DNA-binding CsgD family transcriptional regulator